MAKLQAFKQLWVAKGLLPYFSKKFNAIQCPRSSFFCDWLNKNIWIDQFFFGRKTTDPPTHSHECTQVLLQTVIGFLVQPSQSSEFCPIELPSVWVKNYSKCRHNSIKVSFFSPCPSLLSFYLGCHFRVQGCFFIKRLHHDTGRH